MHIQKGKQREKEERRKKRRERRERERRRPHRERRASLVPNLVEIRKVQATCWIGQTQNPVVLRDLLEIRRHRRAAAMLHQDLHASPHHCNTHTHTHTYTHTHTHVRPQSMTRVQKRKAMQTCSVICGKQLGGRRGESKGERFESHNTRQDQPCPWLRPTAAAAESLLRSASAARP
jgi:hypothetical protein